MENLDNYHLISCEGFPQKNKLHLDFGAVVLHRLIKILFWVCIYSNFTCYTNVCYPQSTYLPSPQYLDWHELMGTSL